MDDHLFVYTKLWMLAMLLWVASEYFSYFQQQQRKVLLRSNIVNYLNLATVFCRI